jgi:peptide deformylase
MIKTEFKDKLEFDMYLTEQKVRQERGYLTRTERESLKQMLDKNYKPNFIKELKPKLPIVTNINELNKPCQEVTKEDNIKEIIQKLKDALDSIGGLGISANQIGIQKRISYIRIPKYNPTNKKMEFTESIIINAKIIEKNRPTKVNNESCLSFPGIGVTTKRYVFITIEYLNEKMELQTAMSQDLESFVLQHEYSHQQGRTIFDDKWKTK